LLHGDREPGRNEQELLLLAVPAHRYPAPGARVVAQALPAALADAGPAGEVRVADVDPEAAARLQRVGAALEDLDEVRGVPLRGQLQPERAAALPVPGIRRRCVHVSTADDPVPQDVLVVALVVG